jgi:hypothetical protein
VGTAGSPPLLDRLWAGRIAAASAAEGAPGDCSWPGDAGPGPAATGGVESWASSDNALAVVRVAKAQQGATWRRLFRVGAWRGRAPGAG